MLADRVDPVVRKDRPVRDLSVSSLRTRDLSVSSLADDRAGIGILSYLRDIRPLNAHRGLTLQEGIKRLDVLEIQDVGWPVLHRLDEILERLVTGIGVEQRPHLLVEVH